MPERLIACDELPPTADTESPVEITRAGHDLEVRYVVNSGHQIRLRFHGVIAFKWNQAEIDHPSAQDDTSYEVTDSAWLAAHVAVNNFLAGKRYRHLKLCFNEPEVGTIEVLCEGFDSHRGLRTQMRNERSAAGVQSSPTCLAFLREEDARDRVPGGGRQRGRHDVA